MFPSANNDNSDPFSYPDQSILLKPFLNEIIPNSKQEDPSLSFFHFPSPYIHYELELQDHEAFLCQNYELLLHQQPLRAEDTASETVKNMADSSKTEFNFGLATGYTHNNTEPFPGKRSCKRDRHSKINTAKGPRDRRMRLSLEVAREFFGLQDMLGCDKASKTVEWLLKQARPEIKKLARSIPQRNYSCSGGTKSASSTSDCEVVSGIDDAVAEGSKPKGKPFKKEKKAKQLRKPAFRPLAKDLREKARARARARTREKNWSRKLDESHLFDQTKTNDMNQVGSWSPFETGEESATQSQIMRPSLEKVAQIEDQELSRHQCHQVGIQEDVVDESLVIMDKWSQSSMLSYLHNNGIPQEQQFTDFQFFGKPWEAYSNQNLCQYGLSLGSTSFYEPSG